MSIFTLHRNIARLFVPVGAVDVTVTPATLELALTQQAPEVVVHNTFGQTGIGGSDVEIDADELRGTKFTSPSNAGTVVSVVAYTTYPRNVKAVIVLHSTKVIIANGVSDSLLTTSGFKWNTFTWTSPPTLLPNTDYILMLVPDNNILMKASGGAAGCEWYDETNFYNSPTNPTDGGLGNNWEFSIYCTYIPTTDETIEPATFASVLALQAPTVVIHETVEPATLALALTQQTPSVTASATSEPGTLALALTLQAPTVVISCTVTPTTLALALTQQASSIIIDTVIIPDALALALALQAPTIIAGVIITPDAFALALTQQTPSVLFPIQTILPSTLALASTLETPTVGAFVTILPGALALTLTLQTPVVTGGALVTPATLALALTLLAPTIDTGILTIIQPDTFELEATFLDSAAKVIYVTIPGFVHKDLIDPYSGGAWLWLCAVTVPGYSTQRIARNTADIIYCGTSFPKGNFDMGKQFLSGDGSIPNAMLRVAQDRAHTLENIINATKGGEDGVVKIIRTCEKFLDFQITELEDDYDILTAGSDAEWVIFTLGIPNPLTQRIPLELYSSKICPLATPSLFKGAKCQYSGGDNTCTGLFEDCYTKGNVVHWGAEIGLDPNAVRI